MILHNSIKTPDGTIMVSTGPYDSSSHRDSSNSKTYSIFGGKDNLGRSGPSDYEELSVVWEPGMPHEITRVYVVYGGAYLTSIRSEQLNIILNTKKLSKFYAKVLLDELAFRGEEMQ